MQERQLKELEALRREEDERRNRLQQQLLLQQQQLPPPLLVYPPYEQTNLLKVPQTPVAASVPRRVCFDAERVSASAVITDLDTLATTTGGGHLQQRAHQHGGTYCEVHGFIPAKKGMSQNQINTPL